MSLPNRHLIAGACLTFWAGFSAQVVLAQGAGATLRNAQNQVEGYGSSSGATNLPGYGDSGGDGSEKSSSGYYGSGGDATNLPGYGKSEGDDDDSGYYGTGGSATSLPGYESSGGGESGGYPGGGGYGSGGGVGSGPRGPIHASDGVLTYFFSPGSFAHVNPSGIFAPPRAQAEAPVFQGPILKMEAEQAFASGNHPLALELAFGHMAADFPDSLVELKTVKYSPLLRRPVWNIRFGVSMTVRGNASQGAQPIRETRGSVQRNGGQNGRGARGGNQQYGDDYGEGYGDPSGGEYGDDYGDQEMAEDDYDEDYGADMEQEMGGRPGPSRAGRNQRNDAPPQRTMLDPRTNEVMDETLGLVAEVIGDEFRKRYQGGDYGLTLTSVVAPVIADDSESGGTIAAGVSATSARNTPELEEALGLSEKSMPMWIPGFVYLGQGELEEVGRDAHRAGLDLLLHFDVTLNAGRNSTQNISRCRMVNVHTGKALAFSKAIDSREAAQLAAAGRSGERDYIKNQCASFFNIVDNKIKTTQLPQLSPEVAKKRVTALMGSSRYRSLRTLAEIQLYRALNLIDDSDVEIAFDIIGGPEALMILRAPPSVKYPMARKWAIRSQGGRVDN